MTGRYTPPKKQPGTGGDEPRRRPRGVPANETAEERAERLKKERTTRRIAIGLISVILLANLLIAVVAYSNPLTLVAIGMCAVVLVILVRMELAARRDAAEAGGPS